jgi:hypothetical protein
LFSSRFESGLFGHAIQDVNIFEFDGNVVDARQRVFTVLFRQHLFDFRVGQVADLLRDRLHFGCWLSDASTRNRRAVRWSFPDENAHRFLPAAFLPNVGKFGSARISTP